jgi:uncharacterized membrane protein YfcA
MLLLAAALSILIGISLGLLGGGGSILTVPILVYALGVEEKAAIAGSLLIVGVTSAAAAIQHARAGNVQWRTGLIFSGAGMAGAFAGGRLAAYIPGPMLIALFAVVMLATGIAMWRKGSQPVALKDAKDVPTAPKKFPYGKIIAEGAVVGIVTGLVGAGGGFLVVPALALLGGLPMHQAVGTSLVVIALKSFAGFAGYAGHVEIDLTLVATMSAAAVAGSFVGAMFGRRVSQEKLRKGFAGFVLVMAVYLLYKQIGDTAMVQQALHAAPWPFWAGGIGIGLFVLLFLVYGGRLLGVSTGYMDACNAVKDNSARKSWRLPFMGGIFLGGVIGALTSTGFNPSFDMGMVDTLVGSSMLLKAALFTAGGVLIGFGARVAGGCTSGHGIVGVSQLAPSSMISMGAFMVAGVTAAHILFRVIA